MSSEMLSLVNGDQCPQEEELPRTPFHLATHTEPNFGMRTHDVGAFKADHMQRHQAFGSILDTIVLPTRSPVFPWADFAIHRESKVEGGKIIEIAFWTWLTLGLSRTIGDSCMQKLLNREMVTPWCWALCLRKHMARAVGLLHQAGISCT